MYDHIGLRAGNLDASMRFYSAAQAIKPAAATMAAPDRAPITARPITQRF